MKTGSCLFKQEPKLCSLDYPDFAAQVFDDPAALFQRVGGFTLAFGKDAQVHRVALPLGETVVERIGIVAVVVRQVKQHFQGQMQLPGGGVTIRVNEDRLRHWRSPSLSCHPG